MTVQLDQPSVKPAARRTYTVEQFEALSLPDDYRYELVKGELYRMGTPGDRHGRISSIINYFLRQCVYEFNNGEVWDGGTGFVIDGSNPEKPVIRAPDVAFITKERLTPPTGKVVPIVPDLAVEVVSPTDKALDVEKKVAEYLKHGVKLVWLVPAYNEQVWVYRQGETKPIILDETDELDGGEVVKGFKLRVSKLFEWNKSASVAE